MNSTTRYARLSCLLLCSVLLSPLGCDSDDPPDGTAIIIPPDTTDAGDDTTVTEDTAVEPDGADADGIEPGLPCAVVDGDVVGITTQDGVVLEGDLYTHGLTGSPGIVLLHMVPPSNDRSNFGADFIAELRQQGFDVLNLDRRGAGGSEGDANDAYEGPNGKFDALAAQQTLTEGECRTDAAKVVFIGASNGTTTALDYTIYADEQTMTAPAGLVFLTGGAYTENQNTLTDHRELLADLPILFVFSTVERAWSAGHTPDAPTLWQFEEYDPGDHGTSMFAVQPTAMVRVAEFAASAVQ